MNEKVRSEGGKISREKGINYPPWVDSKSGVDRLPVNNLSNAKVTRVFLDSIAGNKAGCEVQVSGIVERFRGGRKWRRPKRGRGANPNKRSQSGRKPTKNAR